MYAIGISGSLTTLSRTTTLVSTILRRLSEDGDIRADLISVADLAADLGHSLNPKELPAAVAEAFAKLQEADVLVIASPIYKASYSGLLKHFLDLLDPKILRGKVVIVAASGGSANHALVIEHQLRPLTAFFGMLSVPTGIYVLDSDFAKHPNAYELVCTETLARIDTAVRQAQALLGRPAAASAAA